ncbi:unnamed protein product [Candida verbasci]|uniref:Protein BZZ1 n=1 Tax=Candida verbasci TaxID=1227364 RepID=A0A9W4TXY4_9ASCO|nr:unnamed protein product [Candida verbasci]
MSVEELSIGNELKDSYKITNQWISNNNNWLSDIDEFYRERSNLEKEYATKLKELTRKYFEKKSKISSNLSVGDEPQITPGSLENASLVMWNELLTQTELISEEKLSLSKEFQSKISSNIISLKSKNEKIQRQIININEYLNSEKSKTEDEVNKAKKQYDLLCQHTESAREKNEKSPSDKHARKLTEKEVEMNIGKNDYLIKINIANRLKDKYYYQDCPEILDYLQELNESRTLLLNKILKNASIIERNSLDKVKEKLFGIDKVIDQNDPKLDSAMFVKHNLQDWKEPQDFYFIPSSIWHDDETLIIKEPELTDLKKRLAIASSNYSNLENDVIETKQKLEESVQKRHDALSNITLSFDSNLQSSLLILERFFKEESKRVKNEVEIEIIQNYAGDQDLSYSGPTTTKKSRFGFLKSKKKGESVVSNNGITRVKTNNSIGSGVFNLRKLKSATSSHLSPHSTTIQGKALYAYQAQGSDETSISPGEQFQVIEEDDGSGWTMINSSQGQGLVPTSYLEIVSRPMEENNNSTPKKKGPAVAPRRGARKIQYLEALYDYIADGDDELSIHQGDKIILIQDDTEGSGWTEGELNGIKGMFPSSYVKKI